MSFEYRCDVCKNQLPPEEVEYNSQIDSILLYLEKEEHQCGRRHVILSVNTQNDLCSDCLEKTKIRFKENYKERGE